MSSISLIRIEVGVTKGFGSNYEVSRVPCVGEQLEIKVAGQDVAYQVIQVRHVANPAPGDAVAYVVLGDEVERPF